MDMKGFPSEESLERNIRDSEFTRAEPLRKRSVEREHRTELVWPQLLVDKQAEST